jgi:histidine triad (HIT) family protein
MKNCLFCNIASGAIPANVIYRDEQVVAFDDINPQAPHHKIIVPRKHVETVNDLTPEDGAVIGQMVLAAANIAQSLNIAGPGYRLVMNCNAQAGQTVFHIHLHLLGGRQMVWPPG